MAISTPVLIGDGLKPIAKTAPFAVNFHSANFGGAIGNLNQELKTAPGIGKATYITHVTMGLVGDSVNDYMIDCRLTLVDGAGTTAFGPIQLQAQGEGLFLKDWEEPLKITDNKALDLTGVGAAGGYYTACFVYIEGFTGQKI
jgi:hypothetical protein